MRSSQLLKGTLEIAALSTIGREPTYGLALLNRLRAAGFSSVADASVYGLLRRLESEGQITSRLVPSGKGPARKYYSLTESGTRDLAAAITEWHEMAAALHRVLEGSRHE